MSRSFNFPLVSQRKKPSTLPMHVYNGNQMAAMMNIGLNDSKLKPKPRPKLKPKAKPLQSEEPKEVKEMPKVHPNPWKNLSNKSSEKVVVPAEHSSPWKKLSNVD